MQQFKVKSRTSTRELTVFVAINDLKERLDDIKGSQSNELTRWGIIVALVVGIVQVAVALLLK